MPKSDNLNAEALLKKETRQLYLDILAGNSAAPGSDLDHLMSLRLVTPDVSRPGHYLPLDPEPIGHHWQTTMQAVASTMLEQATFLPKQLRELSTAYRRAQRSDHGGGYEYLTGLQVIQDRLTPLLAGCAEELLTAVPRNSRPHELLALSYRRDLEVLAGGAQMRTVYPTAARADEPMGMWTATMTTAGAQIRTSASPFARATVIDRQVAVVDVLTPWTGEGEVPVRAFFLYDEGLVAHVVDSFERTWAAATPWDGKQALPLLTPMQQRALRLTADGLDQAAVAARIGISTRTVVLQLKLAREAVGAGSLPQLMHWWGKNDLVFQDGLVDQVE
ncbi:hypothetical protein ACFQ0T_29755 [Kitasatospora gansuensis]